MATSYPNGGDLSPSLGGNATLRPTDNSTGANAYLPSLPAPTNGQTIYIQNESSNGTVANIFVGKNQGAIFSTSLGNLAYGAALALQVGPGKTFTANVPPAGNPGLINWWTS